MKNTIPNRLFVRLPIISGADEPCLLQIKQHEADILPAEGFSAAEIGEIFNIVPEQNIHLNMVLPPKKI